MSLYTRARGRPRKRNFQSVHSFRTRVTSIVDVVVVVVVAVGVVVLVIIVIAAATPCVLVRVPWTCLYAWSPPEKKVPDWWGQQVGDPLTRCQCGASRRLLTADAADTTGPTTAC